MAQINVSVPDALQSWIDSQVASGRFSSASDYLRDLVRRDEEEAEHVAKLRAAIDEGLRSGTSERMLDEIYEDFMKRRDAA